MRTDCTYLDMDMHAKDYKKIWTVIFLWLFLGHFFARKMTVTKKKDFPWPQCICTRFHDVFGVKKMSGSRNVNPKAVIIVLGSLQKRFIILLSTMSANHETCFKKKKTEHRILLILTPFLWDMGFRRGVCSCNRTHRDHRHTSCRIWCDYTFGTFSCRFDPYQ